MSGGDFRAPTGRDPTVSNSSPVRFHVDIVWVPYVTIGGVYCSLDSTKSVGSFPEALNLDRFFPEI